MQGLYLSIIYIPSQPQGFIGIHLDMKFLVDTRAHDMKKVVSKATTLVRNTFYGILPGKRITGTNFPFPSWKVKAGTASVVEASTTAHESLAIVPLILPS